MSALEIMSRACDGCLLTKDRIVTGERAADIIRSTREIGAERHFLCHKGSIVGREIACRLHAERFPSQAVQVATRLTAAGLGEFVIWIDPDTLEPDPNAEGFTA